MARRRERNERVRRHSWILATSSALVVALGFGIGIPSKGPGAVAAIVLASVALIGLIVATVRLRPGARDPHEWREYRKGAEHY